MILLAAHAGINEERLAGNTLGVVVGPHKKKRKKSTELSRIFHSEKPHAWGLLDGVHHYDFFGSISIPEEDEENSSTPGQKLKTFEEGPHTSA